MNSKQVNFFIVPDDLKEIDNFLKENNCLLIKRMIEDLKNISNYDIILNEENIYQVYLYHEKYKNQLEFEYLDSKEYYYVDILKSYAIEFSIGGFYPYSKKELHRSRLYFVTHYYDKDDVVIWKDADFIKWADNLFKVFKKQFLKKEPNYSRDFISDKFIDWVKTTNAKKTVDGTKFIIE